MRGASGVVQGGMIVRGGRLQAKLGQGWRVFDLFLYCIIREAAFDL